MISKQVILPAARALLSMSERVPLLRQAGRLAYTAHFRAVKGEVRLFQGVYRNFAEASRAVPRQRRQGYDNDASALRLAHERFRIYPFDYPVMFWLSRLLADCRRLLDWGGNVGISYFGYRRYLIYPPDMIWLIADVPAVVSLGRTIAAQEDAPGLRFTTSLEELEKADILLAAGSLQFIEDPFAPLQSAPALPRHILLNKVPAYDLPDAVTLQNMGSAFCPNHLFNRAEFVTRFERMGYRLMDEWTSPDLSCRIPFFRKHAIPAYTGFYFAKRGV